MSQYIMVTLGPCFKCGGRKRLPQLVYRNAFGPIFSKGGAKFSGLRGVHQLIVPDGGGGIQVVQFSWKRSDTVRGMEQGGRRQQHCFGQDGGSRAIHCSWALVKGLYGELGHTRCVLNCTPQALDWASLIRPVRQHKILRNNAFHQMSKTFLSLQE